MMARRPNLVTRRPPGSNSQFRKVDEKHEFAHGTGQFGRRPVNLTSVRAPESPAVFLNIASKSGMRQST
jgi:hypothetical protein